MRSFVVAIVVAVSGCAHSPVPEPTPPAKVDLPWYGDLQALAREAADLRGIPFTQPFEVVPLDDDAFFEAYAAIQRESGSEISDQIAQTLTEFTGSPAFDSALRDSMHHSADQVRREQLIAFYVFPTHRLVVRKAEPPVVAAGGDRVRSTILAHEVGHAVQDQLGVVASHKVSTFDEAMAWRAVLEGDATLTASLLDAKQRGIPVDRAIERGRISLRLLSTQQMLESSGLSPELMKAPAMLREIFLFPYFRGQAFMFDLYSVGGAELAARALREPPTRTAEIFSPRRWLGGSNHLESIGTPPRQLGSLLFSMLLSRCGRESAREPVALEFARSHYVDDSFRRVGPTLSWVTLWDWSGNGSDAKLHEAAGGKPHDLETYGTLNREFGPALPQALLTCLGMKEDHVETLVKEDVVAKVVFAPEADRKRLASTLARTPISTAPRVTDGEPREPELTRAFRQTGTGVVQNGRWTHAGLGLSMKLDRAKLVDNPGSALTAATQGGMAFVLFVDDEPTRRGSDGFVNSSVDTALKTMKLGEGVSLATKHTWAAKTFGDAPAEQMRGEFTGPVSVRAIAIPTCKGSAAIYVIGLGFTPSGLDVIDGWFDSMTASATPPICAQP